MRVKKSFLKQIKRNFKHSNQKSSKIDQILDKIPYKKASVRKIGERGRKIIRPARDYLTHKQKLYEKVLSYKHSNNKHNKPHLSDNDMHKVMIHYHRDNPIDSRTLSFETLKRDKRHSITLCGFVGGYRLVYNNFYHQVSIFLLLRYVSGITYNNKFEYLTNHLWIDTNLANRLLFYGTTVGVGDCVIVHGKPSSYNGRIGHLKGFKVSLDDAIITNSGYPIFKHDKFTYHVMPYNHGHDYIYYSNAKLKPNIILGREVDKKQPQHIKKENYYIGYSNKFDLGVIIHQGRKFKAYKHNPRLVVTFHNYRKQIIRNIRWTTSAYSIKNGTVLTSAKNYQHHPRRTERNIDHRLQKALKISYKCIIQNAM